MCIIFLRKLKFIIHKFIKYVLVFNFCLKLKNDRFQIFYVDKYYILRSNTFYRSKYHIKIGDVNLNSNLISSTFFTLFIIITTLYVHKLCRRNLGGQGIIHLEIFYIIHFGRQKITIDQNLLACLPR